MDGFINVLKAPGMTSSNVVYDVRRLFQEKRAGHLGTLDPGAAGVLPVSLGRASKLFDLFLEKQKTYIFEVLFGVATDTLDAYGTVMHRVDCDIQQTSVRAVLDGFLGTSLQRAPAYSALKVDGRKMYDLARAGEIVPDKLREIQIDELTLLEQTGKNRFLLRMRCSRGTYVRVVAEDIGSLIGVPACVTLLIREASGPFTTANAHSIQELEELKQKGESFLAEAVISCETALGFLPALILPGERRKATMNALPTGNLSYADGYYRLYSDGFLGLGRVENRSVRLEVHLY